MSTAGPIPLPESTGRYLVLLDEEALGEAVRILERAAGLRVATASDVTLAAVDLKPSDAILFEKLGIAVIHPEPKQLRELMTISVEKSPVLAIEEDRVVYAIPEMTPQLAKQVSGMPHASGHVTWGLQATGVEGSRLSGKGIRVAVLDTGLDLQHPDFDGRTVVTQSFVPKEAIQDCHGHGTHCIGTACGPRNPSVLPRYGIAYDCEIFVAKVLNDWGCGSDQEILAGINWAVTNKCPIVSMSLGVRVFPGQPFSAVFETAARRALTLDTLIIAAAGNDSRRDAGYPPAPVGHPANCPSILAVGAVDTEMKIAFFSNSGPVGIAGPGVEVYSSSPIPTLYKSLSGTSMAAPHVAGIAALHAEANPLLRGHGLYTRITSTARPLGCLVEDVGAGLVQAPA